MDHWSLDLECNLGVLCGKCSSTLVEGEPISEAEKKSKEWLESILIRGGLDIHSDSWEAQWLSKFVEDNDPQSEPSSFHNWIKTQGGHRPMIKQSSMKYIDLVERYVLAAMLKHMCLVKEASQFAQNIISKIDLPVDSVAKFKFEPLRSEPQKMKELCEMKGVAFNLMDTQERDSKLLYAKLKQDQDIKKVTENYKSPDPYELITTPIIEKISFQLIILYFFYNLLH